MADSLVIIPTYNEKGNIDRMIDTVMQLPHPFHVLIIDDGSPDGTADIVKSMMPKYPNRLFIEERTGKLGLGTAYIHGFKWALKRNYAYIFEMDADFSHPPNDLLNLYDTCANQGADMSVGSRYIKGGGVENWEWIRKVLSVNAGRYVRLITWMPVKDSTAGFVCYTNKVLSNIDLDKIQFIGYAFQIEMKFATYKLGYKIKEVPIIFKDREVGESKMSMKIFKEALWGVLKMKIQSFFKSYKRV